MVYHSELINGNLLSTFALVLPLAAVNLSFLDFPISTKCMTEQIVLESLILIN